jgi:hypothetical protein
MVLRSGDGTDACRIWRAAEVPIAMLQDWIRGQWEDAPTLRPRLLETAASQISTGRSAYQEVADLIRSGHT